MGHGKFVTTINCMDGRVQIPVNEYLLKKYEADYVDTITEAGPNKILSDNEDKTLIENIKMRYEVSTIKHDSKVVAVVGHYDCGGNPAEEAEQKTQILDSVKLVKSWNNSVEVIGLWVDSNWAVNEVTDSVIKTTTEEKVI